MTYLSAKAWPDNASLIAEVAEFWNFNQHVAYALDLTYNTGKWWKKWRPFALDANDVDLRFGNFHFDYREGLPWVGGQFDLVAFDPPYCVDAETEILTRSGWKKWYEVMVGMEAYTINMDTQEGEWQPIKEAHFLPLEPRTVLSMESKSHSSLTTLDHRWPVWHRKRTGPPTWRFERSDGLRCDSTVPTAAPWSGVSTPLHSDAFVELVAWFWTEGTLDKLRSGTTSTYGNISQSHEVNADNCARIRKALTDEYGPATVGGFPRVGKGKDRVPRWREVVDGHKAVFWFNSALGAHLTSAAPERVVRRDFLLELTADQIQMFVDVSLAADGHQTAEGYRSLGQRSEDRAESFQFACTLAGIPTFFRYAPSQDMWVVGLRRRKAFKPSSSRPKAVIHDGQMWCVTTDNATWLARRRGHVYFTGNCSTGGRDTSTIGDMNTAYGMTTSAKTPEENQEWINLGLTEAVRLCKVGGFVLCKVQDYRSSGELFLGAHYTLTHALTLPVKVEAIYHHVGKSRAQPKTNPNGTPRRQASPRNNASMLYLLRKTNNKEANNG